MAVQIKGKTGKVITLLSPKEKGRKFADELSNGFKVTNDGYPKLKKNGEWEKLTDSERAYRSGYLDARKDIGKAFNSKSGKNKSKH